RAAGWTGSSRSGPRSPSTRPANRSSGPTATSGAEGPPTRQPRAHAARAAGPADMATADPAALVAMGKRMAATNGYTAMQSSSLYVTDGDEIDWAYGKEHIFMYTIEMYPSHSQVSTIKRFYPPDEVIAAQTARNRNAILMLIEAA